MAYELTGKIKLIQEPKTFDSGFTMREMVVIIEDGKYPQEINLEFVQEPWNPPRIQPQCASKGHSSFP